MADGIAQPRPTPEWPLREEEIDQRGNGHAAQRRYRRQDRVGPARQCADRQFSFDLEADQQKKIAIGPSLIHSATL